MEPQPFLSYTERSKEHLNSPHEKSETLNALHNLEDESHQGKMFSPESWNSFESSLQDLGFLKKESQSYLSNVGRFHGQDVLVRRASMHRLFNTLESGDPLGISLLDSEPNATILGSDISGIESALSSGFGWVVEGKVAGVFGFTNEQKSFSVDHLEPSSPSLQKKHEELMRRVSGALAKEDVLFMLFRIHKSAFPETLLEDEDFDDMGDVNPFIIRLYAKSRQAH